LEFAYLSNAGSGAGADLPPSSLGAREEAEHETDNIGTQFLAGACRLGYVIVSSNASRVVGTFSK
jgi:hypothetical protein